MTRLQAKDAELASLRRQIQQGGVQPPEDQRTPPRIRTPRVFVERPGKEQNLDRSKKRFNNDNYCWSHGYDNHEHHASPSCRYLKAGHQITATVCNNLAGSQKNKGKVWA